MRIYAYIYVYTYVKKKKKKNSQKSYKTETKTAYFAENQRVFIIRIDVTSREGARVQGTRRRARTACAWGCRRKSIFVTDSKTRARGACSYFL